MTGLVHTVGMTGEQEERQLAERWALFDRWGPYALLALGMALTGVTSGELGMDRSAWTVTLALVAAALALEIGRQRRTLRPSAAGAWYFFTRWALSFALVWVAPFHAFYAILGYFTADRLLPARLVRPGLFVTAVIMAGSNIGGFSQLDSWTVLATYGGVLCVHIGLVFVFSHLAEKEEEQARARKRTIVELERSNAALQQALDENAALHAQLLVQAREAGIADERRRMAAEIHDTLAQGLTGIIAQLQVVANAPDPGTARVHVDRAAELARHSLGEARRSVHNLAPVALEHDGLPEALKKTVADWGDRNGVRADFTVTGTAEPLHEEVSATLLRIVQEALSNAARHAAASRLGVTLSFMGDEVTLDVRDDGRGFDPLALPPRTGSGGFGLDGMRARAERIAGSLSVESEPGFGTAVSARVPLVHHD